MSTNPDTYLKNHVQQVNEISHAPYNSNSSCQRPVENYTFFFLHQKKLIYDLNTEISKESKEREIMHPQFQKEL